MALFEQFKNWLASGQQQATKKDVSIPNGTVESSNPPSFAGKSAISQEEKRKRISQLTPREYELCLLLLEGYTLRESAKQLSIKYSTANTHMTGIYKKLGVNSRAQLIINYHDINENRT